MTIPNKITTLRLILSPVFFFLFFTLLRAESFSPVPLVLLWVVWGLIELSDILDGFSARKLGLESDLGKLFDPFADIVSRMTFFLCFTVSGIMPVWVFIILMYRELGMLFLRGLSSSKGNIVAAQFFGKMKAVFYSLSGAGGLILVTFPHLTLKQNVPPAALSRGVWALFLSAAGVSVLSFLLYLPVFFRKGGKGDEAR